MDLFFEVEVEVEVEVFNQPHGSMLHHGSYVEMLTQHQEIS